MWKKLRFSAVTGGEVVTTLARDLRGYMACAAFHMNFVCVYFNVR